MNSAISVPPRFLSSKNTFPFLLGLVACAGLGSFSSCGRFGERVPITESREISKFAPPPSIGISSSVRFFDDAHEKPEQPANFSDMIRWTVPEGWSEPTTPDAMGMRLADLRFGPNQEGECYISIIVGSAGGLEANVNRWRAQMGQPPYSTDEVSKLPQKPFFNREATFVDFEGDFAGFGADVAKSGYRLLGLIYAAPQATIFVKLTGPKELVEQNTAAFDSFCQSIGTRPPDD